MVFETGQALNWLLEPSPDTPPEADQTLPVHLVMGNDDKTRWLHEGFACTWVRTAQRGCVDDGCKCPHIVLLGFGAHGYGRRHHEASGNDVCMKFSVVFFFWVLWSTLSISAAMQCALQSGLPSKSRRGTRRHLILVSS